MRDVCYLCINIENCYKILQRPLLGQTMLLKDTGDIFEAYLWMTLFVLFCVIYSYWSNGRRQSTDPRKRNIHPAAIVLVLFTWPILLVLVPSFLILRIAVLAILFGLFIIVFTLALIGIRRPLIFVWLDKVLRFVGDALLEANTRLIRLFLSPWSSNPQPPY